MTKNIVLCCDGTASEFVADKTNVVKLYSALVHDPSKQIGFYHPGLGTMEPVGALSNFTRKMERVLGRALGYGLENDIRDAYIFLMRNFTPGDRVFLFGFSRGAYTVRAVASMLRMYGLIRDGNEPLVSYAIRMLTAVNKRSQKNSENGSNLFRLANEFRKTFSSRDCTPYFVGVWDTVSSIGWIANPLRLPFSANNPDIEIGRHAISLDERRAFFPTNLWIPKADGGQSGPKNVKQVWFPGVHSDVGGGYPEAESGLSKIPLQWMLNEAADAGLLLDKDRIDIILGKRGSNYAPLDSHAKKHESLIGAWYLAEFVPKKTFNWVSRKPSYRMNLFRRRPIPSNSMIHESAFQQDTDYVSKLPRDAIRVS